MAQALVSLSEGIVSEPAPLEFTTDGVIRIGTGLTPEEIIEDKPYLTIAGIYTALAYYYANKESLDIEFTQYQEECQRLEAEYKTNY